MPLRNRGDVINLVTGQRATPTTSLGNAVGRAGESALFGSSGYVDFNDLQGINGTTPVTIAWMQEYRGVVGFSTVLNWKPVGATSAFAIYQGSDSAYRFACGPRAGTIPFFAREAPADGQFDIYVLVVAAGTDNSSNSNYTLFRNGLKSTPSSTSVFGTNTNASARIGALDSGGDPFEGLITNFTIWDRALTDTEGIAASTNLWQLYATPSRNIWIPTTSSSTTVVVTGVAATGAIGTVTVTGKALVSVTGVFATGAVGTVTVSAGSVAQVTGVETTSAVGTATAIGKALIDVTGVVTTGAVGTVVAGSGTYVDVTGVQTTSAVGNVAVPSGPIAVEGVFSTGYVGNVLVITVAWVPIDPVVPGTWATVNDSQTPGWSAVNDAQTPNWN